MTAPRRTPAGPRNRRQATPLPVPDLRTAEKDLSELAEPDDLLFPDDLWPQGSPDYVVVIHQRPDWPPNRQPSLIELLRAGNARTREPEPDMEAEP